MKKMIAWLLCLLMLATVTACGAPKEGSNPDVSPTASEQVDSTTPAFDTAWASNEFEKLIPKLPFEGWKVKTETDTVYELEVVGLNTSAATNPPDSGEKDGADKDSLLAYLNTLPSYGFTVQETGSGYQWLVTDANGNEIEFMVGDGGCWVTITKKTVG